MTAEVIQGLSCQHDGPVFLVYNYTAWDLAWTLDP